MSNSLYYGYNPLNHEEIYLNRKDLSSPHMLIVGSTGSGASYRMRKETLQLADDEANDVIYLTRYRDLSNDGRFPEYVYGWGYTINPLDCCLFGEDIDQEFGVALEVCLTIGSILLKRALTKEERCDVEKACASVIKPYLVAVSQKDVFFHVPTFLDVVRAMENDIFCVLDTAPLARLLGSQTNIPDNKGIMCLVDGNPSTLNSLTSLCSLLYAYGRMRINVKKQRATWVYIEGGNTFFNDELSAIFSSIVKVSKKYGGVFTIKVNEVISNPAFINCLHNSGIVYMLSMPLLDRLALKEHRLLTEESEKLLTDCKPRFGIISVNGENIPCCIE